MTGKSIEIKACCAAAYGSDVVAMLLGDSYHPGGLKLTRRLAERMRLIEGARVLDVASGRGATALMLAQEYGVWVDGVDLSSGNVALASGAASAANVSDRAIFTHGDAENLPFEEQTFDAVVCECAFCTFSDKPTAAGELARVLRPGGRLGLSDVTADPERLPPELRSLAAWAACIADARPLDTYAEMFTDAGLRVTSREAHDQAMVGMIEQIEARLAVVRMTSRAKAESMGVDFDRAGPMLDAARSAAASGQLGYALLVAEKPR
jgi:hypothetical protein